MKLRIIIAALTIAFSSARAADVPASDASIRELLTVTDSRKLVDAMFPQFEAIMKSSIQQGLQGTTLPPEAQKISDRMVDKMMTMFREEFSWEKLEPLYFSIYRKTFTQEEMDGMLAFYKTKAGAALIKKMPMVLQETMTAMQEQMGPMMQKIQKASMESVEEIKAEMAKAK